MVEESGVRTKALKAGAMATYLRSAIGRASERLVPVGSGMAVKNEAKEPKDGMPTSWDDMETQDEDEQVQHADEDKIHVSDDRDNERYEVHVMKTPSVTASESSDECVAHEEVPHKRTSHWAYCDVLLQSDEHGLGINLVMHERPRRFVRDSSTSRAGTVLKVASFRRLHPSDIGPAEASGKILIGDMLDMIDGERVQSLEDVIAVLERQRDPDAYILLRFIRHMEALPVDVITENQCLEDCKDERKAESDISIQPSIRALVRELVRKNQVLEEELMSSRLKQDEQRIQLEQLHTLYAKTQVDNWSSSFSLPKPLTRPAFVRVRPPTGSANGDSAQDRFAGLSSAANRLIGSTNASNYDIEFAVSAERERLLCQFDQQLDAERRRLELKYEAEKRETKEVSLKKVRMLEYAVKQLLRQCDVNSGKSIDQVASAHVQALRHQLLHKSKADGCLLCLLSDQFEQYEVKDAVTEDLRTHLRSVLDEYSIQRKDFELYIEDSNWSNYVLEREGMESEDADVAV